jgi:hypothetical protein
LLFLIDVNDYYLREIRISAELDGQINAKRLTGYVHENYKFSAFNQPVNVKTPEITP